MHVLASRNLEINLLNVKILNRPVTLLILAPMLAAMKDMMLAPSNGDL